MEVKGNKIRTKMVKKNENKQARIVIDGGQ